MAVVATGQALAWTKDNGDNVGIAYVRRRVSTHLSRRWRTIYSSAARRAATGATIGSESWLRFRNGQTVGSVVRDVESYLLESQRPGGAITKRNGFGGFNRGQRTTRAASYEYRQAKERAAVLSYLRLQYRAEPEELSWCADDARGPRWIARYPAGFAFGDAGSANSGSCRECVVKSGIVEEVG